MEPRPRIIVSMTSYPARIKNVPISVFALVKRQTLPPDDIHLWLATPQFPNKEADLPNELVLEARAGIVKIHWLEKDTYCHKRHEIFKYTKDDDCVFLFDDDVIYDSRLIETVMRDHKRFPNAIIDYEWYAEHQYKGKRILYNNATDYSMPSVNIRWCGQSMIPSNVYPKECLNDDIQSIRDEICPVCDESWFTPWLVANNIPIFCEHFGWGEDIDKDNSKWKGLCSSTHQVEANGYERRDNWLYAVLRKFPKLHEAYITKFGYEG